MSKLKVTVIGAGGKMGTRTSNNLAKVPDEVELHLAESGENGIKSVKERGFVLSAVEDVVPLSDVVVLAVPDTLIMKVSEGIVKMMKPGAGMIILDPAAAVMKEVCMRNDCTFAVAHPCHPSYFLDQDTHEARHDYFGGIPS